MAVIREITLKNYKCHEGYNDFSLPGITIVSGTNNSGKSSLLQGIYLITQNRLYPYPSLALNAELKLGSFQDILNKSTLNEDTLEIGVVFETASTEFEELNVNFIYKNPLTTEISLSIFEDDPILSGIEITYKFPERRPQNIDIELDDSKNIIYKVTSEQDNGFCKINGLIPEPIIYDKSLSQRKICSSEFELIRDHLKSLNKENIKYLRAFRLEDSKEKNYSNIDDIGLAGEYTAEIIHSKWDKVISFVEPGKGDERMTFGRAFDYWISKCLGKNYRIRSKLIDKAEYKITVEDNELGTELSLSQVGFGISQLLPILTMILASRKNSIILIENPEVHLHPKLQADLVDLYLFALNNDRKIVIETHSEHIINRLRVRVKESPDILGKINLLFFEKEKGIVKTTTVELTKDGKLSHWPANFFDQSYFDLLGLIKE